MRSLIKSWIFIPLPEKREPFKVDKESEHEGGCKENEIKTLGVLIFLSRSRMPTALSILVKDAGSLMLDGCEATCPRLLLFSSLLCHTWGECTVSQDLNIVFMGLLWAQQWIISRQRVIHYGLLCTASPGVCSPLERVNLSYFYQAVSSWVLSWFGPSLQPWQVLTLSSTLLFGFS